MNKLSFRQRIPLSQNPATRKLLTLIEEKKTNLILANDQTDPQKFLKTADLVGPEICVLKTHIDIIDNFSWYFIEKLLELKAKHHFLIFEDRKFADIGNTVKMQYTQGIYRVAEWADLVNCHVIPGPGIIEGLEEAAQEFDQERGLIILAQMSSQGNLATDEYTTQAVKLAERFPEFVSGFIGNGGDTEELKKLAKISNPQFVIMTPGVKIGAMSDRLKQQYSTPEEAVRAGSDCIIVGRGIYEAPNQLEMAITYRQAAWQAYMEFRIENVEL